jgi:CHAD domain-containing protein
MRQCTRLQTEAQRDTRRALRSRRYQRLMVGLASWLSAQTWREHADANASALGSPVRTFAQNELERRYEQVRKRGRKLDDLTADELHQLRIAIKKLRYSVDFFAPLFESDGVKSLRSRLSRLQDVLGTLNDAVTLPRLVENIFSTTDETQVAEARGILLGWSAGRANALKGEIDRLWKGFRRSETYW